MTVACLTDGAVYEIVVLADKVSCSIELPPTIRVVEDAELKERIHRGMEWALAPYFVGAVTTAADSRAHTPKQGTAE